MRYAIVIIATLTALLYGGGAAHAQVAPPAVPCTVSGTVRSCELWATTGSLALPDGTSATIWGYAESASAPARLPGPTIEALAGETLQITLHNRLSEASALSFPALPAPSDMIGVPAGGDGNYTLQLNAPGTYLYQAGLTTGGTRQVALGLFGGLIVRPAAGATWAYDAATTFDDEALLIYSEIDPALHANPSSFQMQNFRPAFGLINGRAFPQTTNIASGAGRRLLLRQINAGIRHHSVGLLGLRQTVVASGGAQLRFPYRVVAETLAAGDTLDSLVIIPSGVAPGARFALYDTGMPKSRSSGNNSFGGMLTFITIPAAPPGTDTIGPSTSNVAATPQLTTGTTAVVLSAQISDTANGGSNVTAAEYFIDTLGAIGAGAPMSGIFGTTNVNVNATLNTTLLATLSSGRHTLYVRGQDAAGNWGAVSAALFTLDSAGPSTSGIVLNPNPVNAATVAIQANASDTSTGDTGVTAAEFFIDTAGTNGTGGALTSNSATPTASITGSIPAATIGALSEGTHSILVHSRDGAGNWGTLASTTLRVDRTAPATTIQGIAPSPNNGTLAYSSVQSGVRVSVTVSDPVAAGINSNIGGGEVFIDSVGVPGAGLPLVANDALFNSPSEAASAVLPLSQVQALAPGSHTIYVRGRDAAGNWGIVATTTLIIDKTGPSVSGLTLTPNPSAGAASVIVAATATDPLVPGATASAIAAAEWFIGTDPGYGGGTPLTASDSTFNSSSETLNGAINSGALAPGSYVVTVRARDVAGNWGAGSTATLTVSATPALFYFSTFGNTNPPGVGGTADDADVYFWNGTAFTRVIDASTLGLPGGANVDGFDRVSATQFYMSFNANVTVPGLGMVEDEDIVFYNSGVWSIYFDGTARGLTAANQDIDAISIVGGTIYFSTVGNTNPPGVGGTADDADIYAWDGTSFSRVIDVSTLGLPGAANVDGFVRISATQFYMSFSGTVALPGLGMVQDEDIVFYNANVWSVYFDGTARGLTADNQDIDAFDLP